MLEIVTLASTLLLIAVLLYTQHKILKELRNIRIQPPQKIELPKIEFPKIELPKIEIPKIEIPQAKDININTETLQEIVTLMRVNQAEFQSGLEAFHKAIDKLLAQIPSGEKELDAQKEFMHKFEVAFAKIQEQATEAMNDNSLRLQEILAEFLNKERSNG